MKITYLVYGNAVQPAFKLFGPLEPGQMFKCLNKYILCNIFSIHGGMSTVIDHAEDTFLKQVYKLLIGKSVPGTGLFHQ